ncbi:MAG: alanine racemase [Xanthobacteraceae bacterium]
MPPHQATVQRPSHAPRPLTADGVLTIDLGAVRANYRLMREQARTAEVAAVVKANAYGLGASHCASALLDEGCRTFFVAQLNEALELRRLLPADAAIYVLNGLPPGNEAEAAAAGIRPVLNSLEQVVAWALLSTARNERLPAAIQVDTGMSRLGLSPREIDHLIAERELLDWIDPVLLISHLACADDSNHPANAEQLARFQRLAAFLPGHKRSISNSGGAFLGAPFHSDMVRAGIALYGANPSPGGPNPMRPVVRLDARVIQIRDIPAGTGVGYGLTHIAADGMRLATLGIGYADGWPRSLSGRGHAYVNGIQVPIVGRVSMDSIVIDISAIGEGVLRAGDFVELLGPHQTLDDVARDAGTIPYEILTSLGHRFHRNYLNTPAAQAIDIARLA